MKFRINNVRLSLNGSADLQTAIGRKLGLPPRVVSGYVVARRAVDARKKDNVCLNYHVLAEVDVSKRQAERLCQNSDVTKFVAAKAEEPVLGVEPLSAPPVVVGAGPGGLYAALELARYGYRPVLLERGKPVSQRVADVQHFWQAGEFDPDSNCQFGEGGAGTFSDGKLTTRVNDPVMHEILENFVACGAPENVLYEHKPHVGTDKLRQMVANLSQKIRDYGGTVCYNSQVTDILCDGGAVKGVVLADGRQLAAGAVVLAVGHSARDTYAMLNRRGVGLEAKDFAIGLRIEHPQELIDRAQYGRFAGHPMLGAADYALVYNAPDRRRTAYSFCMCPGGQVVAAASEAGGVVVNGMSNFGRDSGVANAALVVNVTGNDFGHNPLDGVAFQREYERLAFAAGGGNYYAPAQNLDSFLRGSEPSLTGLLAPSYRPGVQGARLSGCLPDFVVATLREGIENFDRKIKGYADGGALLTGVETRTSAPLRILRNRETYVSVTHDGLYPCGEGAGYAGGIMSAALDGYHVARALMARYRG